MVGIDRGPAHDEPIIDADPSDGCLVRLYEDHSWEFVSEEPGDPANSSVLNGTEIKEMQDACDLQRLLQNNMLYKVRSIVPRCFVFNRDDVARCTIGDVIDMFNE